MVDYFEKLYSTEPGDREDTVRHALRPIITPEDNEALTAIPSASEIKEAVMAVKGEKAPGPDGFSASFYHTHWDSIGQDLVEEI